MVDDGFGAARALSDLPCGRALVAALGEHGGCGIDQKASPLIFRLTAAAWARLSRAYIRPLYHVRGSSRFLRFRMRRRLYSKHLLDSGIAFDYILAPKGPWR